MVYSQTRKTAFSKLLQHRLDLTTESLWIHLEGHYSLIGRNMCWKFSIPLTLSVSIEGSGEYAVVWHWYFALCTVGMTEESVVHQGFDKVSGITSSPSSVSHVLIMCLQGKLCREKSWHLHLGLSPSVTMYSWAVNCFAAGSRLRICLMKRWGLWCSEAGTLRL